MKMAELTVAIKVYGSDLNNWPESLSKAVKNNSQLLKQFEVLSVEEAAFEAVLSSRSFEAHSDNLASRIISESLAIDQNIEFLHVYRSSIIRPLLGMAATLVLGLVIGYSFPLTQDTTVDDSFEDYSALLFVEGEML